MPGTLDHDGNRWALSGSIGGLDVSIEGSYDANVTTQSKRRTF